jgi:hypothetical protein
LNHVLTAQDHYIELLTTAESLYLVIDKGQLFEIVMARSRHLVTFWNLTFTAGELRTDLRTFFAK